MMTLERGNAALDDAKTCRVIELEKLRAGHEMALEKNYNEACVLLRFRNGSSDLCRVELRWPPQR